MADYEQTRVNRIKENLDRMQKLGVLNLSLKVKSASLPPPKSSRKKSFTQGILRTPSPRPFAPTRRSSRLRSATPADYSEMDPIVIKGVQEDGNYFRKVCSKIDVYSDEYKNRLGGTERNWTLFVDGYGGDGRRIYDPINGKTCHQCRQKTLGHRTNCCLCNMVRGQFCGDCLFMRYGEHVLEANENPNWTCPVCRGICNCSICRNAKGLTPTGQIYRKVSSLGYKSVAHYLIESEGSNSILENKSPAINDRDSVRRSLPFSDNVDILECVPKMNKDLNSKKTEQSLEKEENLSANVIRVFCEEEEEDPGSIAGRLRQRRRKQT